MKLTSIVTRLKSPSTSQWHNSTIKGPNCATNEVISKDNDFHDDDDSIKITSDIGTLFKSHTPRQVNIANKLHEIQ